MGDAGHTLILPAAHSPGFKRVFMWYTRRLLRKRFQAVHLTPCSLEVGAALNADARPLVLVLNHSSWWDPLITLAMGQVLIPDRSGIAPMDRTQLERFRFFRKLGLFGIHPDDPASLKAMLEYVQAWAASTSRPTLALTPQGRFTDIREPIRLRPGAAATCAAFASASGCQAASLSIEYGFWQSQRPEVFLHLAPIAPPAVSSTTAWQRQIESAMQQGACHLAPLVIARDPAAFVPLVATGGASINPAYDLWLRLRGRSGEITAQRTARSVHSPQTISSPSSGPGGFA